MELTGIPYTRQQQRECADYILSGGPDQRGATLGMFDWFAEEFLLQQEAAAGGNDKQEAGK
jgi:hypothetical protein